MSEAQGSKRRVIASSLVAERPGDTVRQEASRDFLTTLTIFVFRPLWAFRVEIGLLGVVAAVVGAGYLRFGIVGGVLAVLLMAGLLSNNRVRPRLLSLLHAQSVRRSFDRACRYALIVSPNDRTPRVRSVRRTPAGDVLCVQMPPGLSTLPLIDGEEVLASNLSVQKVKIERDRHRADRATVCRIESWRTTDVSVRVFPRPVLRTGRATFTAPGSPRTHVVGHLVTFTQLPMATESLFPDIDSE